VSFLSDLLFRCTPDEIERIKGFDVQNLHRKVLWEAIDQVQANKLNEAALQSKFDLSQSHYDKINSVLFTTCVTGLTNGTMRAGLSFFLEKDLLKLYKHQLKLYERRLSQYNDPKVARDLYWQAFQDFRRFPVSEYDEKLVKQYADKYIKVAPKLSEEDKAEIWLMYEFSRVFVASSRGNMAKFEPAFLKSMATWEKKVLGKPWPRAHFHYYLCWANYYDYCTSDLVGLVGALQGALEAYDKAKGKVPETYKVFTLTKLAKAYCQDNRFDEALQQYRDAFAQYGDQLVRNYYHPLMYSVIAILAEEYTEAEKVLDTHLKQLVEKGPESVMGFDILRTYSILYMYKGDYKKAAKYIQQGLTYSRTDVSRLGDILQRMVHNAFFVLTGDLETAKTALSRNYKFLRAKADDKISIEYMQYFDMLKLLIDHRLKGKKLPTDFEERMHFFRQGIMKLYGGLLDKILVMGK
jgi:tetratricopeptide (TPR) repeat protein